MTDIEAKALALVREVLAERDLSDKRAVRREVSPYTEALCRTLEQHEAFKQEVSDVVETLTTNYRQSFLRKYLGHFIIPKPKPDPLVEVLEEISGEGGFDNYDHYAHNIHAALEARGLEIREKGQSVTI
jgi:hypothetical protein